MRRLLIRTVVVVGASVVLALFLVFVIMKTTVESQVAQRPMPDSISAVVNHLKSELEEAPSSELSGRLDAWSEQMAMPAELIETMDPSFPRAAFDGVALGEPVFFLQHDDAHIVVPLANGPLVHLRLDFERPELEWGPFGLILLTLLVLVGSAALVLTVPDTLRLHELERVATQLAAGGLEARAVPRKPDAIGQVAVSFNAMANRVQQLLDNHRHLVQAVAHEIRTPISRVRFGLEMMEMAKDDVELNRRRHDVKRDLDELEELVGELLAFSRYDAGTAPLEHTYFAVEPTVRKLALRALGEDCPVELVLELSECTLYADHRSFHRAVRNVLLNALRHANQRVEVRVDGTEDTVFIDVIDDGPG
ncbi:MAG: HAMP domain-containing protein, partial [Proteobacteria bacterium]|nr:HAMP domain-containing protein [Pseudomonadota bacterium]